MRKIKIKFIDAADKSCLREYRVHPSEIPALGEEVLLPDSGRVLLVVRRRFRYTPTNGLAEIRLLVRPIHKHERI